MTSGSPYADALGERVEELHPVLRRYFSAIPLGHVGVGEGVFDVVGTPRRWLRPFLRVLQRQGVVWAGWEKDVPFRIVNRAVDGEARARRELHLPSGSWTMTDAVSVAAGGGVVDRLGVPQTVAAAFDVTTRRGALVLTSRAVGLRWGRLRMRVPRVVAPTVRLTERYDDGAARQHVEVTIDAPLLGRVYEYAGGFSYRLVPDPEAVVSRKRDAVRDRVATR
ncbi:DUF4166 domain-containing protein [Microbacterium betulae]|uniref:DUF4166 domain-containing protein n=1 Tax=Microbacterium betulae TaxID=2981139 RepID=A0AA97FH69_9MICO|nr:DUF4166 domain-containing protein [Microbacterium sp. AB]WOF23351.1 DUF4166 domain-containing protein [Microbacterium sp. AB]